MSKIPKSMKGSFTIGKIAGIEISVHWTFFLLVGILLIPNGKQGETLWNVAFVLTIFLCVVLHELGHALAAKWYGIVTKDITLLPIGGVARLQEIPKKPKQELVVAMAGPLVNVLILLLLYPFVKDSLNKEVLNTMTVVNGHNFFVSLFAVNSSLIAFNLLPAFPMDGGRVLRALLALRMDRVNATRVAAIVGQFMAILFGIVGLMFNPMLVLIAFFVYFGAQQEWQLTETTSLLSGGNVRDVMTTQFVSFQSDDPLSKVIEVLVKSPNHDFLIFKGDRLVGTLDQTDIIRALSKKGEQVPVSDVMNTNFVTVDDRATLENTYDNILKNQGRFILVNKEDTLLGIVDLTNILEFIMVKQAESSR